MEYKQNNLATEMKYVSGFGQDSIHKMATFWLYREVQEGGWFLVTKH